MEVILGIIENIFGEMIFEGFIKGIRFINKSLKKLIMKFFRRDLSMWFLVFLLVGCSNVVQHGTDFRKVDSVFEVMQERINDAEVQCDSALLDFDTGLAGDSILNKYKLRVDLLQHDAQQLFEEAKAIALDEQISPEEFFVRAKEGLNYDSLKHKLKVLSDLGIRFFE
jgi:hypothetical protein